MNIQEALSLLTRYYNGETSDEEEILLRRYFTEGPVPADLESEKELFDFYSNQHKVPVPSSGFEERIITAIDGTEDTKLSSLVKRRVIYTVLSSAAVVLILIGSYFFFINKSEPADTFSDPAIAYTETLKILYDVSAKLNNGINALEPVGKIESAASQSISTLQRHTAKIEKNLRSLDYLDEAMGILNSPLDYNINK